MRPPQEGCQPLSSVVVLNLSKDWRRIIEGYQFDCQYFDKLNMTIKLIFETASSSLKKFCLNNSWNDP